MSKNLNRRDFIKTTTATTAGVATIASGITLTTFVNAILKILDEKSHDIFHSFHYRFLCHLQN